jgi:hypothetical protein
MASIPVPESVYVAKYGKLPDKDEIKQIRALWDAKYNDNLDEEWRIYWRDSDKSVDILERYYLFWQTVRGGVEWPQARAGSDD